MSNVAQPKKPNNNAPRLNGHAEISKRGTSAPTAVKSPIKISTVSHTLEAEIAERLRHFAFRERISESAVIEFSLRVFFGSGDEAELGNRLRAAGAALRRKS